MDAITIRPQAGPQETFLSTPADIAIYGGAAGGGKTWALLMEPLRHIDNPNFGAVIFRRTYPEITNEGGMWDESGKLYPLLAARPNQSGLHWEFPTGARVKFAHMQHEPDKFSWQGSQIALIEWDELTHFSAEMFFYMLSRNRSTCGVRPYIRATCNPDAESWVADLIAWWIDPVTGYPVPERAGVVRWFLRDGSALVWADSPGALAAQYPDRAGDVKSLTFIPASLEDNPILMAADPGYLGNLRALPLVEQERLLRGNWKIRRADGLFHSEWFRYLDHKPGDVARWVRFYDLAIQTKQTSDYTTGALVGQRAGGALAVADVLRGRWEWPDARECIIQTALQDGPGVTIGVEQVAFQAAAVQELQREPRLLAHTIIPVTPDRDKYTRAMPWAERAKAGLVELVRAPWNGPFLAEVCDFPLGRHDDQVDAVSGAVGLLAQPTTARQTRYPF